MPLQGGEKGKERERGPRHAPPRSLSSSCLAARGDSLAASGMLANPLVRRRSPTTPRGLSALPLSHRPRRARDRHYSDSLLSRFLFVALAETLDAAGGVHQLLLAGEEGVALAADLQAQLFLGGVGLPGLAAGAVDQDFVKLGVQVRFHGTAHCRVWQGVAQVPRAGTGCRPTRGAPPGTSCPSRT